MTTYERARTGQDRRADVRTPMHSNAAPAAARTAQDAPAAPRSTVEIHDIPDPPSWSDEPPAPPPSTFTIHATIDDFPFDVTFVGRADQLAATVARLREIGAVPPGLAAAADRPAPGAPAATGTPTCADNACDRVGKPMKESTKNPGTFYCPGKVGTKNGEPIYCKSKA